MSPPPPTASVPPLTGRRLALSLLLVGLLLGLGMESDSVFAGLTRGWQVLLQALGLGQVLARVQHATSGQVTTRSLPAVVTYGLLYVGSCLLLLHLLLRNARRTRWVAHVYLGLLGLYALLVAGGKLGGDAQWAYRLSRRIIDFVVSPLPVMLLLPLLWPGWGRRNAGSNNGEDTY